MLIQHQFSVDSFLCLQCSVGQSTDITFGVVTVKFRPVLLGKEGNVIADWKVVPEMKLLHKNHI